MYKQNFQKRNNFPRSKRRVKTIDPMRLIQKAREEIVEDVFVPQHQFSDFLIVDALKQNITEKGYVTPSPIQDQVIPMALQGQDVIGMANTGTGKTAAFLIPIINKIFYNRSERAIIVAPTRELAVQIQDELKTFVKGMNIFSVLCIGGVGMQQQVAGLRRNPSVIIGTPGRLKDLKNQGKLSLATCSNIVLDEVDRMLDMGFIADVRFIMSHLPKRRQSFFFSATMTPQINEIIKAFSQNPTLISVKSRETAVNVDQDVIKTFGKDKLDILQSILSDEAMKKVIVFGRTKWGIEKLSQQLIKRGINVAALHGNKNQNQRQRALESFRRNEVKVLLATDVVARGIDVDDVTHVINFDLPESYEDYIHRIGRTGRNNKKGIALSFVD